MTTITIPDKHESDSKKLDVMAILWALLLLTLGAMGLYLLYR